MSFAIITDSTSDISPACAQELGIYVIPLHVIIEGEDLLDQVQITAEEYVARMAGSKQLPHTSQPSAGEFKALFDRVLADGHDSAIFISLCSEWSACYANACLVADTHELDVRCVDSRTGSGAASTRAPARALRACWWNTRSPCAMTAAAWTRPRRRSARRCPTPTC
ncbi:DegV family protein [Collinsella sp. TM05-38]|uniref:DegV family protein n=1 Tax=Collinsella sp. TM05-38 TaxID=2292341 RepID=UPI00131498A4|nr:DegV family protein [Collinsella sp. TM05-38]